MYPYQACETSLQSSMSSQFTIGMIDAYEIKSITDDYTILILINEASITVPGSRDVINVCVPVRAEGSA